MGQAMLLPKPNVCTAGEKSGGLRQDMGDRQGSGKGRSDARRGTGGLSGKAAASVAEQ